ncbi:hypothetical protein MHL31_01910 [Lutibacter sp. A80]|uniref:hypothetical protein n=1 Tax=Lutibacter sp. A80 TaxID=2918453 RepID=UPI001F0637C4|nr:hypothetical protein [Lutibacter sp. A80]UMB60968.1 hypothetical protein MHL31_01910 [Lutibacter sp. A80]
MKDNIDNIFKNLENTFDVEEPKIGHFNRFEAKLNQPKNKSSKNKFKLYSIITVAASVVLLFGVWLGSSISNKGMELARVSTEMEETQSYFATTIKKELLLIEKERNSTTEQLINDGLKQLEILEQQYKLLTVELKESTEDKRIIYAMVSNFQQRIEILHSVLTQIDDVKQLKTQDNEKFI